MVILEGSFGKMGKLQVLILVTIIFGFNLVVSSLISNQIFFNKNEQCEVFAKPGCVPWNFDLTLYHDESPINIQTELAQDVICLDPLVFNRKIEYETKYLVKNSGHGVEVVIDPEEIKNKGKEIIPELTGGILPDDYCFQNIHYHWGSSDNLGSEHSIDSEEFALEGHIVMYKKSYGDFQAAANGHTDGIVVFTFFAKIGCRNKAMKVFLKHVHEIEENESTPVEMIGSEDVLWPLVEVAEISRSSNIGCYSYPGGLTTEPYSKIVTFLIFPSPITVSHNQLEALRKIKDHHNNTVLSNHREQFDLNERPIIYARDNFYLV